MSKLKLNPRFIGHEFRKALFVSPQLKDHLGFAEQSTADTLEAIWDKAVADFGEMDRVTIVTMIDSIEERKVEYSDTISKYIDRIAWANAIRRAMLQFAQGHKGNVKLSELVSSTGGASLTTKYAILSSDADIYNGENEIGSEANEIISTHSVYLRDETVRSMENADFIERHELSEFPTFYTMNQVLAEVDEEKTALNEKRQEVKLIYNWLGLRSNCFENILWQTELFGKPLSWDAVSDADKTRAQAPFDVAPKVLEEAELLLPRLKQFLSTANPKTLNTILPELDAMSVIFPKIGDRPGDAWGSDHEVFSKIFDHNDNWPKGTVDKKTKAKSRAKNFNARLKESGIVLSDYDFRYRTLLVAYLLHLKVPI